MPLLCRGVSAMAAALLSSNHSCFSSLSSAVLLSSTCLPTASSLARLSFLLLSLLLPCPYDVSDVSERLPHQALLPDAHKNFSKDWSLHLYV